MYVIYVCMCMYVIYLFIFCFIGIYHICYKCNFILHYMSSIIINYISMCSIAKPLCNLTFHYITLHYVCYVTLHYVVVCYFGTDLEDQDMWRFSGIIRDVFLTAVPSVGLWDIYAAPSVDFERGSGNIRIYYSSVNHGTNEASGYKLRVGFVNPNNETATATQTFDLASFTPGLIYLIFFFFFSFLFSFSFFFFVLINVDVFVCYCFMYMVFSDIVRWC
jgi:hypothetical protein